MISNTSKYELESSFTQRLLIWFESNGRHDLPWQQHKTEFPDPYQVWLSEVMLQQTQVKTVIPYFQRFMQSFPTVQTLADAQWDEVAEHWAGLGYYARARNLHKGAKQLVDIINNTGDFPQTVDDWEKISGVGRSTAGAIVAMGLHGYGVICDGNVKRVLTRWAGVEGDITKSVTTKALWALAEDLTSKENSGHFAQAIMDMGATICTRTKPACLNPELNLALEKRCPIQEDCYAYANNKQLVLPHKVKKQAKPSKYSKALIINNPQGETLWLQRPETGIWSGLWCLPLKFIHKVENSKQDKKSIQTLNDDAIYEKEFTFAEQLVNEFLIREGISDHLISSQAIRQGKNPSKGNANLQPIKHTLTHFHWYILAEVVSLNAQQSKRLSQFLKSACVDKLYFQWVHNQRVKSELALPKAMDKVLASIN